jgi:hypothetical protein
MYGNSNILTEYWGWESYGPLGIIVNFDKRFQKWDRIQSTEVGPERDALLNELRANFLGAGAFEWNRAYKINRQMIRSTWGFGAEAKSRRAYVKRMVQGHEAFLAHHQDNAIFLIDYLKAHPEVE